MDIALFMIKDPILLGMCIGYCLLFVTIIVGFFMYDLHSHRQRREYAIKDYVSGNLWGREIRGQLAALPPEQEGQERKAVIQVAQGEGASQYCVTVPYRSLKPAQIPSGRQRRKVA